MSMHYTLLLSFYTHLKEEMVSFLLIEQANNCKTKDNEFISCDSKLIFYLIGYVYYDDPENEKQKWIIHKDGFMVSFESAKWPGFYLEFGDQVACHICSLDPMRCKVYYSDGVLCTNCNPWVKKVWWRTSIFVENAVIPQTDECFD